MSNSDFFDLNGVKILIVEDNHINQIVLEKFLERWGASFDCAKNGLECLTKFENKDFDIILMDLEMPELDGYEATAEIRSMPYWDKKNIPIIAVTASKIEKSKERAYKAGVNDYVVKPIDPHELNRAIQIQLGNRPDAKEQEIYGSDNQIPDLKNYLEMADGDNTFLVDILSNNQVFFTELKEKLELMVKLNQSSELHFYKHKAKPLFEMLQIDRMNDDFEKLVNSTDSNNPDSLELCKIFQLKLAKVIKTLEEGKRNL